MLGSVAGVRRLHRMFLGALALAALMLSFVALAPLARAAGATGARAADPVPVSVDITQPQPSNNIAEGPVGTNIVLAGKAASGDSIQAGFAPHDTGCATGFQQINGATVSAGGDGSFKVVFAWPQIANNQGARYNVCVDDTTSNSIVAAPTLFQVDSTSGPQISLQEVANPNAPTPGAGTPTPTPPNPPDGSLYANGFVQIVGSNFTPGGTKVLVFLTAAPLTPGQATADNALSIVSGSSLTSRDGSFTVVTQLPAGQQGALTITVTSADGNGTDLPSLVSSQQVQVVAAPTPTASPSPTPSPTTTTVAPTPTPNTGGGQAHTPGVLRISAAIGTGLLSAVFFIAGVALLVSASGMPRP